MQKKRHIEEALLLWANEPDAIKKRLAAIADTTENERIELDAVTKVGQIHGIFVDRSINENYNVDQSRDAMLKAAEEAMQSLTKGQEA